MNIFKIRDFACITSILLASLAGAKAANTLTAWNFDNVAIGANASPAPSGGTGFGSAEVFGFGGSSSPTVVSQSGSSTGSANAWSVGNIGGANVGWNTSAAIGSQGAKFAVSTFGYYQIQVSFDVYSQPSSEAALLVQYSQDGVYWQNANIISAGTAGILATNINPTNGIVTNCTYLLLTNSAAAGWNNGVTVDLAGVPGVANDPNFAIRIVNAAKGTNCLDQTGAQYNSASGGDWTLDNVTIQGVSFDTVANWSFDNLKQAKHINAPLPAIANNTATAACIGFGTPAIPLDSVTFTKHPSTNDADVTSADPGPYSSTGAAGANVWRLRGQPGNGWLSTQPIGSQGAQFDVSTVNYTNIIVTFDLFFTTQGESRMCVLYTTNGWTTTNVANLACSSQPSLIQTNSSNPNIVIGTYMDNTIGSLFYNYMSVDFTGVPGVQNNPNFGFRIVNAAQNGECVNFLGQPYNNSSGNCRLDNVSVSGQFNGQIAPIVTNAPSATVDFSFTNTFNESVGDNNVGWHTNISSIYVNGVKLTNTAYTVTASNIIFTPSTNAPVLTVAGFDYIVISATNYTSAKVVQYIGAGTATKLAFIQPAAPSASGGTLTVNPSFTVTDKYGNGTTNPYSSMVVTATVSNSPPTWNLGGSTIQPIINGSCTFTDLTATVIGSSAVSNAVIQFNITGGPIAVTNSTSFVIGAPPSRFTQGNLAAIQVDTTAGNSTFSVIEIKPSVADQTQPVNINPITATGTNALRLTASGGAGHLALSDDGTFLVFGAFDDGSSATVDETFNLNRAVGTLNYTNGFTKTGQYMSDSLGGSAVRAACSPNNVDFLIDDKGGLYVFGNGFGYNVYEQNNYSVRSFGGSAWAMTQKTVAEIPSPAVFQFNNGIIGQLDYYNSGNDGPWNTTSATPPPDPLAVDFYMISTNGTQDPASFGILYIIDQNGGTDLSSVVLNKFSRNSDDSWTAIGSWTNSDNANTLFATTNGDGGVYLYYSDTTKNGDANSIVRVTDSSIMGSINIISTNTIYTAPAGATVLGITFVPQQTPYAAELTPPPILTAQTGAKAGYSFSITNTPDDSGWRSAITNITVNGSALPTDAYDTTQSSVIVFYPSKSSLLQTSGAKNIVIFATGYSDDSVVQTLESLPSPVITGTSTSGGALTFNFTSATGLSFSVLATNDLTAPVSTWPVIGTAVENPADSGNYQFTDLNPATNSAEFYILRQP